jgi:hypothetical protein
MTAVWRDPHDWAVDEIVTVAHMNMVRDALDYLSLHASLIAFDMPHTVDPRYAQALANVGTANDCHYNRVYHGGEIDTLRISVGVSNGNVSLAVYDQTGTGVTAAPSTRLQTSGSVACPAAGLADVALGGAVTVGHSTHWFALSNSGTTATFRSAAAIPAGWHNGLNGAEAAAHPAPASASPSASRASQLFIVIGIP